MAFLALHLFFPFSWLNTAVRGTLSGVPDQRDWFYVRAAGERLLRGGWKDLYAIEGTDFFWRYPPYALYLAALLAMMSPWTAYWATAVTTLIATIVALWLLFDALRPSLPIHVVVAVFTSVAFNSTLATGQASALLALMFAAGLWGILRGVSLAPYVALGLLSLKPNWLPTVVVFVLAGRRRTGLAVLAACAGAFWLAAIPLGLDFTRDFLSSVLHNNQVLARYDGFKSITLLSFLQQTVGFGTASDVIWGALALGLLALGVWAWRPSSPIPVARQLGLVVLMAVALNPYVSFYDGLVLIVPAIVWWGMRDSYATRFARQGIGTLVAFVWLWDQTVFYYLPALDSLTGADIGNPSLSLVPVALTAWIALEVADGYIGVGSGRRSGPRDRLVAPALLSVPGDSEDPRQ